MAYPKGRPRPPGAGRKKGTPNKRTVEVEELIARTGLDPVEALIEIALGNLHCNVCRGKLKTKYKLKDGTLGERTCESCYGSGWEIIAPELRFKAWAEVAQYHRPKRKAIDLNVGGEMAADILRARRFKRQENNDQTTT